MDLQSFFYIVSIIYMSVAILILLAIGIVLFVLKQKITHLANTIEEKAEMAGHLVSNPSDVAFNVGSHIADKAIKKVHNLFTK